MKAKMIFTDKEHVMQQQDIFLAPVMHGAHTLKASDDFFHGHLGFGVAITPSSCYVLSLMEPAERKKLLESIYSKSGVGLSVARLCIGSSDYSPEIYSYDDTADDISLAHFSIARDEEYIIPIIKEILLVNPDIHFLASPWSPPGWMKTGGSMCGGYMRDKYVDCYAEYFVKYIKAYAKHGIKISAVTPQNECNTQQNYKMPACIWHPETEAHFICALSKKLKENSLDTRIWALDHNFNDIPRVNWMLENCEGLAKSCDGIAFHYYNGTVEQTAELLKKYPELSLHFTEGGPRLDNNYDTDWAKWGLMMIKSLKAGYSSFIGWNLMLDETGGPNIGPFNGMCGGLVTFDRRDSTLAYSGQYKAFCHIAPYVNEKSKIYPLDISDSFNLKLPEYPKPTVAIEGVLIDNGDKKIAVIVNPNNKCYQLQLELDSKRWYLELHGDSISTVLF